MAPGDLDRVYFVSGGSEATETALKMARQYYYELGETKRRNVINNEYTASMGAYYQVMFGRMNDYIVNRNFGQSLAETRPIVTVIQAQEQPLFCAKEQQFWIDRILANHPGPAIQIFAGQGSPTGTEVFCLIDVSGHITTTMTIKSDVGRGLVVWAGIDPGNPGSFR